MTGSFAYVSGAHAVQLAGVLAKTFDEAVACPPSLRWRRDSATRHTTADAWPLISWPA